MRCAKCNNENPADALFCMKCGAKVERHCPSCNTLNPNDANFCRKCGAPLGTNEAAPAHKSGAKAPKVEDTSKRPVADTPEGERKTVTMLFADIKGSMDLMEDLDPEEARLIVVRAEECYRSARAVAISQESKWRELRATTSLARLLRETKRSGEPARRSPRFTNGSPRASTPRI